MDAGPRYLEGTTVGSGRDIIGVRRDRIADIISTGREIIARAKGEKILPDTITGATAALLVTIAGYGEPLHLRRPGEAPHPDHPGAIPQRSSQPGLLPFHPSPR